MTTGQPQAEEQPQDDWLVMYDNGATLEQVALHLRVSKQHVPNLLHARGRTTRSAAETRELRDNRYLSEHGEALKERFLASRSVAAAADDSGLTAARARRLLERLLPDFDVLLKLPRRESKRYAREELLASLVAAAGTADGNLTTEMYARHVSENPTWPDGRAAPGPQVMMLRFGSWGGAVRAAGLPANHPSGPARRFDDPDELLAAVVRCWRDDNAPPSVQRYEEWQREQEDAPSGATARKRLGSWNTALVRAWQVVHGIRLDQDDPDIAVPETVPDAPAAESRGGSSTFAGEVDFGSGEYRLADENATVAQAVIASTDAYLANERAVRAHARLQNRIAAGLGAAGLRPRSPWVDEPQYDLAFTGLDGAFTVVEVKSCTPENQEIQQRLGLGQVLRYAHQLGDRHPHVRAVLATELLATPDWLDLLDRHGVAVIAEPAFDADLARLVEESRPVRLG